MHFGSLIDRSTPLCGYRRISSLEMLDEVEELDLVLEHYAITWGLWAPDTETAAQWSGWGLKKQKVTSDEEE